MARVAAPISNFKTTKNEVIEIKVTISFISHGTSLGESESRGYWKIFRASPERKPAKYGIPSFSKIEVEGGTEENKVKFYTALYQVLLGPGHQQRRQWEIHFQSQ